MMRGLVGLSCSFIGRSNNEKAALFFTVRDVNLIDHDVAGRNLLTNFLLLSVGSCTFKNEDAAFDVSLRICIIRNDNVLARHATINREVIRRIRCCAGKRQIFSKCEVAVNSHRFIGRNLPVNNTRVVHLFFAERSGDVERDRHDVRNVFAVGILRGNSRKIEDLAVRIAAERERTRRVTVGIDR